MPKLSDPSSGLSRGALEQLELEGDSLGDHRQFWDRAAAVDAIRAIADQEDASSFETSGMVDAAGVATLLPATGRGAALEIGCGIGRVLQHLAPRCHELHGIDISAEMVEQARRRLAHLSNVHVHVGNGYDLGPLDDESFDLVFSQFVFQHMPKTTAYNYFVEARRVLRPDGLLRFQVPNILSDEHFAAFHHFAQPWFVEHPYPMHFYTPAEVASLLVRAGFWVEDIDGVIIAVARKTDQAGIGGALVERVVGLEHPTMAQRLGELERMAEELECMRRRLAVRAANALRRPLRLRRGG